MYTLAEGEKQALIEANVYLADAIEALEDSCIDPRLRSMTERLSVIFDEAAEILGADSAACSAERTLLILKIR